MTFEEETRLKSQLQIASLGIQLITELCHTNIEAYEACGKTGTSMSRILGMALEVKKSMEKIK